jgi:hypothetical protein
MQRQPIVYNFRQARVENPVSVFLTVPAGLIALLANDGCKQTAEGYLLFCLKLSVSARRCTIGRKVLGGRANPPCLLKMTLDGIAPKPCSEKAPLRNYREKWREGHALNLAWAGRFESLACDNSPKYGWVIAANQLI